MHLGLDLISELEAVEIGDGALHCMIAPDIVCLSLDLISELEIIELGDAFDFHCSKEACRLASVGLVAPDIVHLDVDLISELEAIVHVGRPAPGGL